MILYEKQTLNYFPWILGPVCGTDGNSYPTLCALETEACRTKSGVTMAYPGNCVIPLIPECKTTVKNPNTPMARTPTISDTPLGNAALISYLRSS